MRAVAVLTAIFAIASLAYAQAIFGPARVLDGNTLEVAGQRIRLYGIDAPESAQQCRRDDGSTWACGQDATAYLRQLIGAQSVNCNARDRDRDKPIVAVCSAGGVDLNGALVAAGLALAYRDYSVDYVDAEESARDARKGLWTGEFVAPCEWRRGFRLKGESATPSPSQKAAATSAAKPTPCLIKGNISKSGRIYHVPGSRFYSRTKIDESAGERWFCTEDEARAAGWRAPRS